MFFKSTAQSSVLLLLFAASVAVADDTPEQAEVRTNVAGKVIIIDADGTSREIEFGKGKAGQRQTPKTTRRTRILMKRPEGWIERAEEGGAQVYEIRRAMGKYMIGVGGAPVSDVLRAQLRLPKGEGMVVAKVFEDSPAAYAGIKQFDVITSAAGKSIGGLDDLARQVALAGKSKEKLKLEMVRGGKKISVQVAVEDQDIPKWMSIHTDLKDLPIDKAELRELLEKAMKDVSRPPVIEKLLPEEFRRELPRVRGEDTTKQRLRQLEKRIEQLEQAIEK